MADFNDYYYGAAAGGGIFLVTLVLSFWVCKCKRKPKDGKQRMSLTDESYRTSIGSNPPSPDKAKF